MAFTRDGKLISAGLDSRIMEWDLQAQKCVAVYEGFTRSVCDIDLKGNNLAVGGHDNAVSLYDVGTGARKCLYPELTHWTNAVALSACGKYLAAGTRDGDVVLLSARTGQLYAQLARRTSEVAHMTFSGDGKRLLAGTKAGRAVLYETVGGRSLREYPLSSRMVHYVEFLSNDAEFIGGCWDGNTYRVSVRSGEILAVYGDGITSGEHAVEAVSISDDLECLITVGFDGYIRVFEFESGRLVSSFRAHPGRTR